MRSCDVTAPLQVYVLEFNGKRPTPPIQSLIDSPECRLAGSFMTNPSSDLYVTCQVICEGKALAMPTQTAYKSCHKSTAWNEWLQMPITHEGLLRDACIVLTVWDIKGPREKAAVGTTVLNIFNSDGRVREGDFTLELTPGLSAEEFIATTPFLLGHSSAVDSCNSNISTSSDKVEVARLERLLQEATNNELPTVPWLDPFSIRSASQTKEKRRKAMDVMTLSVRLPFFDLPVVYCEIAGDITRQSGGYTVMDPEILYTENLVEDKHMKLTRMRQRGRKGDEQLKPNPKYVHCHLVYTINSVVML